MTGFLDNLNLRPQEKRLVVVIAAVVFLVLNWYFVWPHFGDWAKTMADLDKSRATIVNYNKEIQTDLQPGTGFKAQLSVLQKQQGPVAAVTDEQVQLQNTVRKQAVASSVTVGNYQPVSMAHAGATTNEFFEEQSIKISVECREEELVNFLYNIGNDSSMIRVRELHLKPADTTRIRLHGEIILSANYQRLKAVAPPKPAEAAKKPAMIPGPKMAPGDKQLKKSL